MREMLDGGDLDVLTGDYLAELTMLILGRDRLKDATLGYAKTFLRQLEDCLGPRARARASRSSPTPAGSTRPASRPRCASSPTGLGLDVDVAHVEGDDLRERAEELGLGAPLTANAYLGGVGHRRSACAPAPRSSSPAGSPTPRWSSARPPRTSAGRRTDYDALAGAVVAGHVLECGTQATGGNYSFFGEIADLRPPRLPDRRDPRRRLVA